ncbi:Protein of unknown function DUF3632 [Penicillium chrysogenum]|uniref:Uncharacterized protein n=1 Tax=Penicillium chrysogenum TaxID=5076 RepID=A0ABQ8WCH9_PENCH|nr:Protein of unknown function DUF3632 [Penicillium chrysogenum]KAJ5278511.1 Protein of unknown function DUF3632 [Penicillium chrysogenum]
MQYFRSSYDVTRGEETYNLLAMITNTGSSHAEVLQQLFSNTIDSTTAVKELSFLGFIHDDTLWALWGLTAADFPSSHS